MPKSDAETTKAWRERKRAGLPDTSASPDDQRQKKGPFDADSPFRDRVKKFRFKHTLYAENQPPHHLLHEVYSDFRSTVKKLPYPENDTCSRALFPATCEGNPNVEAWPIGHAQYRKHRYRNLLLPKTEKKNECNSSYKQMI
ncbi:hypothetical protein EVAR_11351_1 [Eumeta japonica]|uniref:Uncharacterized protein n=1 Tax=Eumeta variegata TaxID=151549 RepID=A0A4C1U0U5_EUMVA|nr:hypothetical protein EVAR_11351_1 [Eumeta japonica]